MVFPIPPLPSDGVLPGRDLEITEVPGPFVLPDARERAGAFDRSEHSQDLVAAQGDEVAEPAHAPEEREVVRAVIDEEPAVAEWVVDPALDVRDARTELVPVVFAQRADDDLSGTARHPL